MLLSLLSPSCLLIARHWNIYLGPYMYDRTLQVLIVWFTLVCTRWQYNRTIDLCQDYVLVLLLLYYIITVLHRSILSYRCSLYCAATLHFNIDFVIGILFLRTVTSILYNSVTHQSSPSCMAWPFRHHDMWSLLLTWINFNPSMDK